MRVYCKIAYYQLQLLKINYDPIIVCNLKKKSLELTWHFGSLWIKLVKFDYHKKKINKKKYHALVL